MRAYRPRRLEAQRGFIGDRVEQLEPCQRALDARDRRRVGDARAERRGDRKQRGMERPQRASAGHAGGRARAVDGLDRRLDLKSARPPKGAREMEVLLAECDELPVPE